MAVYLFNGFCLHLFINNFNVLFLVQGLPTSPVHQSPPGISPSSSHSSISESGKHTPYQVPLKQPQPHGSSQPQPVTESFPSQQKVGKFFVVIYELWELLILQAIVLLRHFFFFFLYDFYEKKKIFKC